MRNGFAMLTFAAVACSSATPPASPKDNVVNARFSANPVTVLVTNTTSTPMDIRGYPSLHPPMPQPLGGMLRLGSVAPGSSACFEIPDSLLISGTIVGTAQTQTIVWTSSDPVSLTGLDTATWLESGGQTAAFTPSSSAGWSVTLPAAGAGPAAAERCAP
jgi:hypothetical protein